MLTHPQAEINVIEGDAECVFVEPADFVEDLSPDSEAGAGHCHAPTGKDDLWHRFRLSFIEAFPEMAARSGQSEHDPGMLDRTVGIDQTRPDAADT